MIKSGDQIIYIPTHIRRWIAARYDVDGSILALRSDVLENSECETGFVTSFSNNDGYHSNVFCRFWSKDNPKELRTKSCSELVWLSDLMEDLGKQRKDQAAIDAVCEKYGIEIGRENDD